MLKCRLTRPDQFFTICVVTFITKNISCDVLPEIKGAKKGQPCDLNLYTTLLQPMYQAITRQEFLQSFNDLSLHLNQTPGLETKSCFTHYHANPSQNKDEYYRYLQCRQDVGVSEPRCECSNEEPFLSNPKPNNPDSCQMVAPSIGSPCKPFRTRVMDKDFYHPFRSKIEYAKTASDIKLAFDALREGFTKYREEHFLHSDIRRACYNNHGSVSSTHQNPESLACFDNEQCACVSYGQRFRYKAAGNGRCEALQNSICKAESGGTSGAKYSFVDVPCADADTECINVPIDGIAEWVTLNACLQSGADFSRGIVSFITLVFLPACKIIQWLL